MKKRVIAVFLSAMMMLSSVPVWADKQIADNSLIDSTENNRKLEGKGTEEDPYLISDSEDLFVLLNQTEAGMDTEGLYYCQTQDIDMSGESFAPIGGEYDFSGIYDGAGYTIENLEINTMEENAGLFGTVSTGTENQKSGIIKNLKIDGAQVTDNLDGERLCLGVIAGNLEGTIENCQVVDSEVSYTGTIQNSVFAGAVIGFAGPEAVINGCTAKNIVGTDDFLGGYNGKESDITLENSGFIEEEIQEETGDSLKGSNEEAYEPIENEPEDNNREDDVLSEDAEDILEAEEAQTVQKQEEIEEEETSSQSKGRYEPVYIENIELPDLTAEENQQYILQNDLDNFNRSIQDYTIAMKNSGVSGTEINITLSAPVSNLSGTTTYSTNILGFSKIDDTHYRTYLWFNEWAQTDISIILNYGTTVSPRIKEYSLHVRKDVEKDNRLESFELVPMAGTEKAEIIEDDDNTFNAMFLGNDADSLKIHAVTQSSAADMTLTYKKFSSDEDAEGTLVSIPLKADEDILLKDCFSKALRDSTDGMNPSYMYSKILEFQVTVKPRNNQEERSYTKKILQGNFRPGKFQTLECTNPSNENLSSTGIYRAESGERGYHENVSDYKVTLCDLGLNSDGSTASKLKLAIRRTPGSSPYVEFDGIAYDLTEDWTKDPSAGWTLRAEISSKELKEGVHNKVVLKVFSDAKRKKCVQEYNFDVSVIPSPNVTFEPEKNLTNGVKDNNQASYTFNIKEMPGVLKVKNIPDGTSSIQYNGQDVAYTGNEVSIELADTSGNLTGKYLVLSGDTTIEGDEAPTSWSIQYRIKSPMKSGAISSGIIDYWPAPGQFVNSPDWGAAPEGDEMLSTWGVSLGGYGGYIIADFSDAPIQNNTQNAGGMDFVVNGNAFNGNSEPANVLVSNDKETWYNLAGGYHFEDDCIWDYKVTYTNDDPEDKSSATKWTDNQGNTGVISANSYHQQQYFPLTKNYGKYREDGKIPNSFTMSGVLLPGRVSTWGYADAEGGGITGDIQKALQYDPYKGYKGFDLSWAVDQKGNPVYLEEAKYVKVQNATHNIVPPFGELSAEITDISQSGVLTNAAMVKQTPVMDELVINGQSVSLSEDDIKEGGIVEKTVYYSDENQGFNVSVKVPKNIETKTDVMIGNCTGTTRYYEQVPKHKKIRIVTQNAQGPARFANNPTIYYITFEQKEDFHGLTTDKSELYMAVKDTVQLKGVFTPSDPEDASLEWASGNEAVASVDKTTGKVTAVAAGETTVTAYSQSTGAKAACAVKVGILTDSIELRVNGAPPESLCVKTGEQDTSLKAVITPANAINSKQITWSSSDEAVLKVEGNGLSSRLTGVSPGTAKVKAETTNGVCAECEITVLPKDKYTAVVSVEKFTLGQGYVIEPAQVVFEKGDTAAEVVTGFLEDNGYDYTYTGKIEDGFYLASIKNADTGVVNVPEAIRQMDGFDEKWEANGKNYDAPDLGEFAYTNQSGWIYHVNGTAADVGMSQYQLKDGDVVRLQFTLYGLGADLGGSSFSGIEALDVAEKSSLTLKVADWAEYPDDFLCIQRYRDLYDHAMEVLKNHMSTQEEVDAALAAMPYEEAVPVTEMTLDTESLELSKGESRKLQAGIIPSNASDTSVKWESSNENVAVVTESGEITAVGKGEAVITAYPNGVRLTEDSMGKAEDSIYGKQVSVRVMLSEQQTIEYIEELISSLKDTDALTLKDQDAVAFALAEYEALSEEIKGRISEALVKALYEAEEKMRALKTEYTERLTEAVNDAKAIQRGNYTQGSWDALQTAIKEGEDLLAGDFTEQEVDAYLSYLKVVIKGLDTEQSEKTADKSALKVLLEEAAQLAGKTEMYTEDSIENLKKAINRAKQIFEDKDASQDMVDAQVQMLEAAMDALVKLPGADEQGGKTITNSERRVSISGADITADMTLQVTLMNASDKRVAAMRKEIPSSQALTKLYDIQLMRDGKEIKLTKEAELSFEVGEKYNGQTLTVLHSYEGKLEKLSGKVENGILRIKTDSLEAFGTVLTEANEGKGTGTKLEGGSGNENVSGRANAAKTGDETPVDAWMTLFAFAACAIAFSAGRKRKIIK